MLFCSKGEDLSVETLVVMAAYLSENVGVSMDGQDGDAWNPMGSQHLLLAEDGFSPSTSGLWAQHASAAPLCSQLLQRGPAICDFKRISYMSAPYTKSVDL